MGNVLLGKTCKAMYKLSGKTISQLSEETDLSVDTINNLFYARIQKPGFDGVTKFIRATGFHVRDMTNFLEMAEDLPETADITDEFTKYIFSSKENGSTVKSTKDTVPSAEKLREKEAYFAEIEKMNAHYEEKLEKYKEAQLNYVSEIQTRYKDQIAKMDEAETRLLENYERSLQEIKESSQNEIRAVRTNNRLLGLLAVVLILSNFITILLLK